MTQTLYAFLAMMMLTLYSYNQQRAIISGRINAVRGEIDLVATGVAAEQLDLIGSKDFDANGNVDDESELTAMDNFGDGADTYDDADDIDDYHGKSKTELIVTDFDTLSFDVSATVQYVEESGDEFVASLSPTYFKEVTLVILGELGSTVTMSRVYSYKAE